MFPAVFSNLLTYLSFPNECFQLGLNKPFDSFLILKILYLVDRSHYGPTQRPLTADSAEIDRIMAKIEQDNRVLAELDKTRATVGGKFKN